MCISISKELCERNDSNTMIEFSLTRKKKKKLQNVHLISSAYKIFDPMRWLCPSFILIKILFQKLWITKIDWDKTIPSAALNFVWSRIKKST